MGYEFVSAEGSSSSSVAPAGAAGEVDFYEWDDDSVPTSRGMEDATTYDHFNDDDEEEEEEEGEEKEAVDSVKRRVTFSLPTAPLFAIADGRGCGLGCDSACPSACSGGDAMVRCDNPWCRRLEGSLCPGHGPQPFACCEKCRLAAAARGRRSGASGASEAPEDPVASGVDDGNSEDGMGPTEEVGGGAADLACLARLTRRSRTRPTQEVHALVVKRDSLKEKLLTLAWVSS
jgi:hypothetical protein